MLAGREDTVVLAATGGIDGCADAARTLARLADPGTETVLVVDARRPVAGADTAAGDAVARVTAASTALAPLIVRLNVRRLLVLGVTGRPLVLAAIREGSWDGEAVLVATLEEIVARVTAVSGGALIMVGTLQREDPSDLADRIGAPYA